MDNELLEQDIQAIIQAGGTDTDVENYLKESNVQYSVEEPSKIAGEKPSFANTFFGEVKKGAGVAVGAGLAIGAGLGAKKAFELSAPVRTKTAGNLINSIIKPRHKEYMFGKDPGRAIAQEGIWGSNIDSIGSKVDKRLTELTEYSKQLRSLGENATKRVNLETVLEPIKEVLNEFEKAPLSHRGNINKINKIIQDIKGNIPEGANIKDVPIENAYGLKKVIENLQKWEVQSSADDKLNVALKKMYHNIDSSIDVAIPELKSVNSRVANLISAKSAIRNRAEILSKQDPTALGNILSLPIKKTIGSTAFKSGLAKILSEKFGMVGNTAKQLSNVAKKAMPVLGISTSILDAIKYSKDPEAYMYQLETGKELNPKGSMEREIQTGRLI